MFHFLKVIKWAQDFEEKIHHTFKSGRKAILFQCKENCNNCGEPATHCYWGSQNANPCQQEANMAFDRCRRCTIGDTTRFRGENYFIICHEKIIPTLHRDAQEELYNDWQSIIFPTHGDFITFITTALRVLHHRPLPFFIDLPPPTWDLPKDV
jgi:hypothetical protein